jgi:hypothetical protein
MQHVVAEFEICRFLFKVELFALETGEFVEQIVDRVIKKALVAVIYLREAFLQ